MAEDNQERLVGGTRKSGKRRKIIVKKVMESVRNETAWVKKWIKVG